MSDPVFLMALFGGALCFSAFGWFLHAWTVRGRRERERPGYLPLYDWQDDLEHLGDAMDVAHGRTWR